MHVSDLFVLVVDDDPDYVFSTAALLRLSGYQAAMTLSGEEALRLSDTVAPDVVLLDLAMPGMDGYELARRIKEARRAKPPFVVAVSGSQPEDRRSEEEIDLHLVKPVAPEALYRVLAEFETAAAVAPAASRS